MRVRYQEFIHSVLRGAFQRIYIRIKISGQDISRFLFPVSARIGKPLFQLFHGEKPMPKKRTILILTLIACCYGVAWKTEGDAQEAQGRSYTDKGFVWLKEYPIFFRERHAIPGGLAWDRHSYFGHYVWENPDSPFYDRHYVGMTVVLFKPAYPGENMNRGNIIYQYSISQGNNRDFGQNWVHGEFVPPGKTMQWIIAATGKNAGVKAEGIWHWDWPQNRNWVPPPTPKGFDYPNAEEFYYELPDPKAGPVPEDSMSPVYWIEAPPFGLGTPAERAGKIPKPATVAPAHSKRIDEKGYVLVKELPDLNQRQAFPGAAGFEQVTFTGVYKSMNPDSPLQDRPLSGMILTLFKPNRPLDKKDPSNIVCQYVSVQTGEKEGDQIWLWGQFIPPQKPVYTLKVATGKFEGLMGEGTWYFLWPKGWKKPQEPTGYDYAVAHEFILDFPIK
jgi:hypothetical protein